MTLDGRLKPVPPPRPKQQIAKQSQKNIFKQKLFLEPNIMYYEELCERDFD